MIEKPCGSASGSATAGGDERAGEITAEEVLEDVDDLVATLASVVDAFFKLIDLTKSPHLAVKNNVLIVALKEGNRY